MTTILVTAVGGDVSQAVVATIREAFPNWTVVGTDVHQDHAGAFLCDKFRTLPLASSENYINCLQEVVDDYSVGVVVPISEPEIERLVLTDEIDRVGNAKIVAPSKFAVEVGLDKYKTALHLKRLDVPGPWTTLVSGNEPPEFPCVIKSRRGCGSKSVNIVTAESRDQYRTGWEHAIWQELVGTDDTEFTCGLFRSKLGDVRSVSLRRSLQRGLTAKGFVDRCDSIDKLLSLLAESLQLIGSINVQLRMTTSGPMIFEINPRFSSTTLFRHRLGFTDLVWSLQDSGGEPVSEYVPPKNGTRFYRIFDTLIGTFDELQTTASINNQRNE